LLFEACKGKILNIFSLIIVSKKYFFAASIREMASFEAILE